MLKYSKSLTVSEAIFGVNLRISCFYLAKLALGTISLCADMCVDSRAIFCCFCNNITRVNLRISCFTFANFALRVQCTRADLCVDKVDSKAKFQERKLTSFL